MGLDQTSFAAVLQLFLAILAPLAFSKLAFILKNTTVNVKVGQEALLVCGVENLEANQTVSGTCFSRWCATSSLAFLFVRPFFR